MEVEVEETTNQTPTDKVFSSPAAPEKTPLYNQSMQREREETGDGSSSSVLFFSFLSSCGPERQRRRNVLQSLMDSHM